MQRDPEGIEKQFITELFGPQDVDILEVGCGDGRLTESLSALCGALYALDPDPVTIADAMGLLGDKVRFIIGSGEELPFPGGRFETIVYSFSLHHQDPEAALSEAQRVLGDQGRVLILEPDAQSPINGLFKLIHNEDEAYAKAAAAVRTCGLYLAGHGSFTYVWRFDDFNEMVEHLYSLADREPDHAGIEIMESTLNYRTGESPLDIEDSTRWWLLSVR